MAYHIKLPHIFIALFLFLLFPVTFYKIPSPGLDSSYVIAIHLAFKYHLTFGKDLVFTFGPLAILNDRYPIGVTRWVYLLFDIYFFVTLFFLLKKVFSIGGGRARSFFIAMGLVLALFEPSFQWYFLFFLFYLFHFIKEPGKKMAILQPALLSILCFYYKLNLGITAVLLFVVALHYVLIRRKITIGRYALLLCIYGLCILLSARLLNVDLPGYTTGGLQLIDSYNDAMFLQPGDAKKFLFAALLLLLLFAGRCCFLLAVSIRQKCITRHLDELLIHGFTGLALFILFKSSFVRMDSPHISHFFYVASLPVAFLYLYTPSHLNKRIVDISYLSILGISWLAANTIPGIGNIYKKIIDSNYIVTAVHKPGNYYRGFRDYPEAAERPVRPELGNTELKKIIGDRSVDIIPSEISTIYFNGLRYDPRPVIQSYSAYNAYLDSLNYQKYMSPDAPDYILFSLSSIDDRYAFFDESRTKLAIFSHYTLAGEVGGNLLLQKKSPAVLQMDSTTAVDSGRLGEDIPVNAPPGLSYTKIFLDYTLRGRIRRWFYQPPPLTITLVLTDGERMTYRAIPTMLKDGILLGKYIDTRQDFQLLMLSGGLLGTPISKIRIEEDPQIGGFVTDIKIVNTYYTFPPKTQQESKLDSLEILRLNRDIDSNKPCIADTAIYTPDNFPCWIESSKSYSSLIRIQGWAYRRGSDQEHLVVKVIVRSGNSVYVLPSEKQNRPDVAGYYKLKDVIVQGFFARVSKSQLPPGDYQIGILLSDPTDGKEWVRYTDSRIHL